MNDGPIAGWDIRPNVSLQSLYNLLECVMEMAHALQSLGQRPGSVIEEQPVFVSAPLMISTTRRISTSVRKIPLDGNGALLKRCVADPNLHPLKPPFGSGSINFVRHFEERTFRLGWADGRSSDITVPAFDHTSAVHPLHAVRHIAGGQFALYNPFDYSSTPVKFGKWMNTKILEIDGQQFKAEQVLRDMSNKEGAHIEENPPFIVPPDLNIDRDSNTLHRLANSLRFGGLTYLQVFALFTGLYIVNRARLWVGQLPFPEDNHSVAYLSDTIAQSPRTIATEQAEIEFTSAPLAVLGHDRNLRGDYRSGITTTFKAP